MYVPAAFAVNDDAILFDFIQQHGFATLVTQTENGPFASHVPLLFDRDRRRLLGHVARSNPHWQCFENVAESLAIFHGPHAYISPSWYAASPAVPTWNYATVHVYGRPRLVQSPELAAIVERLVERYEAAQARPWPYLLPGDLQAKLLKDIVGFELPIERIEGKFKLGQNRPQADRQTMLARLQQGNAQEQALASFIEQQTATAAERT